MITAARSRPADVVVVGGGPSGAYCACVLARAGARVVLVDGSHPREKPCGGGVTSRALSLVADVLSPVALPHVAVRAARFESEDGVSASVALHGRRTDGPPLTIVARQAFDLALLDAARAAGVRLVPERATDVRVGADGVTVETPSTACRAPFVIGADGANGLLRRRLSRPFTRAQLSIATGYFVPHRTSDEIVLRFFSAPAGYLWSFPRPDHVAVGACAQADVASAAALRAAALAWIRDHVAKDGEIVPYSWPIPSLGRRDLDADRIAGDRWMLTGDAAGLVDPITREGIYFALHSAAAAAATILQSPSGTGDYRERLETDVLSELRYAARIKEAFYRPWFVRLMIRSLEHSDRIGAVMADVIAGVQPYRTLRRRLLATRELGWAVELLLGSLGLGKDVRRIVERQRAM